MIINKYFQVNDVIDYLTYKLLPSKSQTLKKNISFASQVAKLCTMYICTGGIGMLSLILKYTLLNPKYTLLIPGAHTCIMRKDKNKIK